MLIYYITVLWFVSICIIMSPAEGSHLSNLKSICVKFDPGSYVVKASFRLYVVDKTWYARDLYMENANF